MRLTASILIVTYNSELHVTPCLEALLPEIRPDDEVILVDNASADASLVQASAFGGRVQVMASANNRGYSGGNNLAARLAHGDLLILLNPDTQVRPGWRNALAQAFDDETVGIAGSKGRYPDGRIQHAGGVIDPLTANAVHLGDGQADNGQHDQVAEVDYVSGFALATRRTLWERLGGLCEDYYPAYYEEVDYCFRARRVGLRTVFVPQAEVTHMHAPNAGFGEWGGAYALRQRWFFGLRHLGVTELRSMALADKAALSGESTAMRGERYVDAYAQVLWMAARIWISRSDDPTLGRPLTADEQATILRDLRDLHDRAMLLASQEVVAPHLQAIRERIHTLPVPPGQVAIPIRDLSAWLRHKASQWIWDPEAAAWRAYAKSAQSVLRSITDTIRALDWVSRRHEGPQ